MDDDDEYLYGGSAEQTPTSPTVPQPIPLDKVTTSTILVEHLEAQAQAETQQNVQEEDDIFGEHPVSPSMSVPTSAPQSYQEATSESQTPQNEAAESDTEHKVGDEGEEEEEEEEDEDSEDEVEIIMERPSHSLDLRPGKPGTRTVSTTTPSQPKAPQPSLTTEYNVIQRGGVIPSALHVPTTITSTRPSSTLNQQQPQQQQQQPSTFSQPSQPTAQTQQQQEDDGPDPNTLPPVTAPPSHPAIDLNAVGVFDGRSIFEVDMAAMADKPWRRPGSDVSDWFNYGFDEISWEAYCMRRRELGDAANVLKTNVLNFSGMNEEQVTALPPEIRQMVMSTTNAMMNGAGANPAAAAAAMMNPQMMMDMSGMMMGMDGMAAATMQQMMQQMQQEGGGGMGGAPGMGGGMGMGGGASEQVQVPPGGMMMQDGFPGAPGMMNMGMGNDFAMQAMQENQMAQQMFQGMDGSGGAGAGAGGTVSGGPSSAGGTPISGGGGPGTPAGGPAGGSTSGTPMSGVGRGATPGQTYRGRGAPIQSMAMARGRGFVSGRGRVPPPAPVRPASPLPPNVPTGPRNQNKYKDRDGNAPAVDGLDYGGGGGGGSERGGKDDRARRTPSAELEDRAPRKRRGSPGMEDLRSSKRR